MQEQLVPENVKTITRLLNWLESLLRYLLIIALAVMILITFSQVILRYVFRSPTRWAEELVRYIGVWLTFIGCPVIIRNRGFISIEMVKERIPQPLRFFLLIVLDAVVLIFLYFFIRSGFQLVQHNIRVWQLSAAIGFPIAYVYLALPVGGILMVLYQVEVTIKLISTFAGEKLTAGKGGQRG